MKKSTFVERAKIFFGRKRTPGMIRSGLSDRMLLLLGFTRIRRRFKYLNVVIDGEEELDAAWKDTKWFTPTLVARKAVHVARDPVKYLEARLLKARKAGMSDGVIEKIRLYKLAPGYGVTEAEWIEILRKTKKAVGVWKKIEVYREALKLVKEGVIWAEWKKYDGFRTLRWEYSEFF